MQSGYTKVSKQKLCPKEGNWVMRSAWENNTENIQDLYKKMLEGINC